MTKQNLSESEVREISEAMNDANETWEEVAYLHNPKMPCPECGGAGNVGGGIFDSVCVRCMGARVLDVPGSEPPPGMPDFGKMRRALSAYGDALALSAHPNEGLRRALPETTDIPTVTELKEMKKSAVKYAKQLTAGGTAPGAFDPKMLKASKPQAEDGDLSEYTDAELVEFEKDADKP